MLQVIAGAVGGVEVLLLVGQQVVRRLPLQVGQQVVERQAPNAACIAHRIADPINCRVGLSGKGMGVRVWSL